MIHRFLLALPILAATTLAVMPASAQDREALLLNDRPPPREGCAPEMTPRTLPSFDELADSAAVMAAMREWATAARAGGDRELFLLVSVGWNRDGRVSRTRDLGWFLPRDAADELNALLARHLRTRRGGGNLRVRLAWAADEPSVRVGRAEVCPPLGLENVRLLAPSTTHRSIPSSPLRARVVVGADGAAIGASLLRSSGDRDLDDWVIENLNRRRVTPGLIDGQPAEMEYEAVVRFTSRN